ncbi:phosphoribosylformylglycinamidine synthase subunit PurS [Pseudothermotoga sp.]|uniref:phosphoribosylformylglycinamidine synthase subunit PurS n=1 Tax=Pseudothermotoga sp. TaxID=2033661 RepID=UPI0031F65C6E
MYRVTVQILPKEGVFDPQGQTVKGALEKLGFEGVESVRMGKLIELVLDVKGEQEARVRVISMCEKLLANPVVESYKILGVEEIS